jgi:5-methylthioadenosine/S-adenosylhomocysteine deaminase
MGPERCIEMSTINAAKAIGLDREIGSLEVGKRADIAIFDLCTPHSMPANNPLTSLVYSARGTDAHTVIVNGEMIMRARKLTRRKDFRDVFTSATSRAQTILSQAGLGDRLTSKW